MSWIGSTVLGLGVLVVAALLVWPFVKTLRQRAAHNASKGGYAERLDIGDEGNSEENIQQAADDLIRQHGAEAVVEAARRAMSVLDANDRKGQAVGRQVLETAREIQARNRNDDATG